MLASVAILLWLTLHWGLLPRVDQWRPEIERRAAKAIGVPVRIGAITVESRGWVPAFALHDVSLLDAAGRPALALGRVRAALAVESLLLGQLRLAQLHVEGVALDVRRDREGRIHVAGLDLAGLPAADSDAEREAAEWLLAQHEIVVRHGRVRWTDETRSAPALELTAVDFVLRNGLRRHDFRLDATPEAEWGDRVQVLGQFTAPLLAPRSDWRRWSGTLFVQAMRVDVAPLGWYVDLPFEINQGRGAVRAWLDVQQGRWRELAADLALADLWLRLQPALQPLAVADLDARVVARRDAQGVAIEAQRLALRTGDGQDWPAGDLRLSWQQAQALGPSAAASPAAAAPVTGGQLSATRLDLRLLAAAAQRLPLPRAAERWLLELRPAGLVSGLQLRWRGSFESPAAYGATGKVQGLALAAARPAAQRVGRPGIGGADIDFELDEHGGRATLAMRAGTLEFPGVFEEAGLRFDRLQARLDWRVEARRDAPTAVELRVSEAKFSNADAQGEAHAVWRTGAGRHFGPGGQLPGHLDLSGRIERARADRVAAYLPLAIPALARQYVQRAVRAGALEDGSFAVRGDLWHFPFHDGLKDSVFRITGRVRDAVFDAVPSVPAGTAEPAWSSAWPAFQAVQGEIAFDRTSMQLRNVQARLWGVQLRGISARIDDLVERPLLQVEGEGRGPAADLLRYVDSTPLGEWIGGGLRPLSAGGPADLRLALAIPLLDLGATRVRGSVQLSGNDVRIRPGTPVLAGARGRVDFSRGGFTIVGASARVFGGDATFEGGMQADGALRFSAQGIASAEGLRRAVEFPALSAAAAALRGQAAYRLSLAVIGGWPELTVTSDLVGLETDLPPPLAKSAATAWPTTWQNLVVRDSLATGARPAAVPRDVLRLDVGEVVQVRAQRRLGDEGPVVTAAAVGILEPAPAPVGAAAPGSPWRVRANLDAVDVDAWRRAWSRIAAAGVATGGPPALQASLRAGAVVLASRRITGVRAEVRHDPASRDAPWAATVSADQGEGRLQWQAPAATGDAGRIVARLTRMTLPPGEPALAGIAAPEPVSASLPALDVVVEDFQFGERRLGRLELLARQDAERTAAGRWLLDRLWLGLPGAALLCSGRWTPARAGAAPQMALDFGLDLSDGGALAAALGVAETVRGGQGRVHGRLRWAGSPLHPDLANLDGEVHLALESGQFLRADPGAARLLGILSLQSLPRRLLLDFRDVVDEGFAFDSVRGDLQIIRGQARTDNLRMRGVQALVALAGSADLERRTQDVRIVIVPEINAGAASLAYAAINPALGLGTFLAQWLLREPLAAAGTREFHVTGPWDTPKVEAVERSAGAGTTPASSPTPRKEPPG